MTYTGSIITATTALILAGIIVHLWLNLKQLKWATAATIIFPLTWWMTGRLMG